MLTSAIVAIGTAGPAAADARSATGHTLLAQAATGENTTGENTMARCQQLFGLWSRHNTDGYAKPLDARIAMEDCQKGNYAAGVASLKRALERAQIAVPPAESGVAQTPASPPATLKPRGEKRRQAQ